MLASSTLSIVKRPVISNDDLKAKTYKHFSTFGSAFFVVVGKFSGRSEDIIANTCEDLGIPGGLPTIRRFPETANADSIVNEAAIPDCIGLVVFGMSPKKAAPLQASLEKAKIAGDYAIFANGDKVIRRAALLEHLRNLLRQFFDSGPE